MSRDDHCLPGRNELGCPPGRTQRLVVENSLVWTQRSRPPDARVGFRWGRQFLHVAPLAIDVRDVVIVPFAFDRSRTNTAGVLASHFFLT